MRLRHAVLFASVLTATTGAAQIGSALSAPAGNVAATFGLIGSLEQGGMATGHVPAGTTTLTFDGEPVMIGTDGAFLIAFDRDADATATLDATLSDGTDLIRNIAIAPRNWRIERVDTPYHAGRTSAQFAAVRPGEIEAIHAARDISVTSDGWRQRFVWPVHGRQSGWFGSQRVYQGKPGSYHGGADVAVPSGTPVLAPADGVVVLATGHPFTLEGNLLIVAHGMNLSSAFLHLSRIAVSEGARVRQGDVIAYSGATGRATGPHLHWGLMWNNARLDPLLVAGPVPQQ